MKRSYNFGPDQVEAIDSLSTELGIDKQQVLREGLRLLRTAVREVKRGNAIAVVSGSSVIHQLIGTWDDVKRDQA